MTNPDCHLRAAVDNLQTVVWIYPSSEDLFESEENMGAWIANSVSYITLDTTLYSFSVQRDYHNMILIITF